MDKILYKFNLDVTRPESQKCLTGFSIGETKARRLKITLMHGRNPIHFEGSEVVSMFVMKPSDESPSVGLCTLEGDTIVYDVLQSDVSEEGVTKFTLKVVYAENDVPSITYAAHFVAQVTDPDCDDSHVPSDPTYSILDDLLERISGLDEDSEAYAVGTRGGEPVGEDDPAYDNNAKFYAEHMGVLVDEQVKAAESWAAGTRGGVPVGETDPAYRNNSKFYKEEAASSASSAASSAGAAYISETNASGYATTASNKAGEASTSATNAGTSETNAAASALAAAASETNASGYATTASTKAGEASTSATNASGYATTASNKAGEAAASAAAASTNATKAESFAVGGTGTRTGEDTDNANYYYEQCLHIAQGLAGGLLPMGTITFSQLSIQTKLPGYMYDISDAFVSTSDFKDGGGVAYGAGSNVYWTADGYWDVLAGQGVSGVKGDSESAYRKGQVNITKANIGLGNVDNTSDLNKPISTATQTALNEKANSSSLASVATSGSYNDLTDKPTLVTQLVQLTDVNVTNPQDGDVIVYDSVSQKWVNGHVGGGIAPQNVSDLSLTPGNTKVTIKWSDPGDTIISGVTFCKWAGTKLVMKTGSYPTDVNDGTLVVDSTVLDQYKVSGYEVTGLTNGTTYYFQLFPYSDQGAVNKDSANRVSGVPAPNVNVTLTLNGAKQDVITIKDSGDVTVGTCTFNTGETSGTVTISVPVGGGSYKFISSVAKDTTSGTSDYEKTVTLTDSLTQTVNVYPSGALYWYGNFVNATTFSFNTGDHSYTRNPVNSDITINTNSVTFAANNGNKMYGLLTSAKIDPTTLKARLNITVQNGVCRMVHTTSDIIRTNDQQIWYDNQNTFATQIKSGSGIGEAFYTLEYNNATGTVDALWYDDPHENDIRINGAKEDTITIKDSGNQTVATCIFESGKAYGYVSKALLPSGTYTFTSSVAKDTTTGTSDYSKSITLDGSETSVNVYPDGALYWYGNFVACTTFKRLTNAITRNPSSSYITVNTNSVSFSADSNDYNGYGLMTNSKLGVGITLKCLLNITVCNDKARIDNTTNESTRTSETTIWSRNSTMTDSIVSGNTDGDKWYYIEYICSSGSIKALWY